MEPAFFAHHLTPALIFQTQPLMRSAYEENPNMTQEEAVQLIEKCLKVLFYRDARSLNRVRMQRFSI